MLELKLIHVIKKGRRVTCYYASVFVFENETTKYSLSLIGYVAESSSLLSNKYWEL